MPHRQCLHRHSKHSNDRTLIWSLTLWRVLSVLNNASHEYKNAREDYTAGNIFTWLASSFSSEIYYNKKQSVENSPWCGLLCLLVGTSNFCVTGKWLYQVLIPYWKLLSKNMEGVVLLYVSRCMLIKFCANTYIAFKVSKILQRSFYPVLNSFPCQHWD